LLRGWLDISVLLNHGATHEYALVTARRGPLTRRGHYAARSHTRSQSCLAALVQGWHWRKARHCFRAGSRRDHGAAQNPSAAPRSSWKNQDTRVQPYLVLLLFLILAEWGSSGQGSGRLAMPVGTDCSSGALAQVRRPVDTVAATDRRGRCDHRIAPGTPADKGRRAPRAGTFDDGTCWPPAVATSGSPSRRS